MPIENHPFQIDNYDQMIHDYFQMRHPLIQIQLKTMHEAFVANRNQVGFSITIEELSDLITQQIRDQFIPFAKYLVPNYLDQPQYIQEKWTHLVNLTIQPHSYIDLINIFQNVGLEQPIIIEHLNTFQQSDWQKLNSFDLYQKLYQEPDHPVDRFIRDLVQPTALLESQFIHLFERHQN